MPSSEEMYERGVLDAERDELNPFYYQHYFYYRKGYDTTRRRLRRSDAPGIEARPNTGFLLAIVVLVLALGGGAWLLRDQWLPVARPAPAGAPAEATSSPTRTPTARPTPAPSPAPATPTPLLVLGVGGRARVTNLNGAPLRARAAPGVNQRVVARIAEGSEVTILEGPVETDGYIWWRVESEAGVGWSAQSDPEGATIFLEPLP